MSLLEGVAGAAGASLVNPYNLDALIRGLIYVGSGVARDASKGLFSDSRQGSSGGGIGRRRLQSGRRDKGLDEVRVLYEGQIKQEKARLEKIQQDFAALKINEPPATPHWFPGGYAETDHAAHVRYKKEKQDLEDKAAAVRAKIRNLQKLSAEQTQSLRPKADKIGPGSKEWRRFARDRRRSGRMLRYAGQSSRSRFQSKYRRRYRR